MNCQTAVVATFYSADGKISTTTASGAVPVDRQRQLHSTGEPSADHYQQAVLDHLDVSNRMSALRKVFRRAGHCVPMMDTPKYRNP